MNVELDTLACAHVVEVMNETYCILYDLVDTSKFS